jgi:hypothetical protein
MPVSWAPSIRIRAGATLMRTGRLIKFRRADADIHAYLYREGADVVAELFAHVAAPLASRSLPSFRGPTEDGVEAQVREWVESHYPGRAR